MRTLSVGIVVPLMTEEAAFARNVADLLQVFWALHMQVV
jgi:hypothetical protein